METSAITWGEEINSTTPVSGLEFHGQSFTTAMDEVFVMGELVYYNGRIRGDTGISSVDLCLEATITAPSLMTITDCRQISIINTQNTSDPFASADGVTMHTGPDFFCVLGEFCQRDHPGPVYGIFVRIE